MRRLTLSKKMLVAALPLVVALGVLLTITVRADLADIDHAESGAQLGGLWEPLTGALAAIELEAQPENADDEDVRRATDAAINELRDAAVRIDATDAAGDHITSSRSSLSAARRNLDTGTIAPDLEVEIEPAEAYAQASRELVSVGQLLPSEAGDPELGRELLAVVKLAEAKLAADNIVRGVESWQEDPSDLAALSSTRGDFAELSAVLGEFEAIAPDEWAAQFRQAGFGAALAGFRSDLDRAVRAAQAGQPASFETAEFEALIAGGVEFLTGISTSIVERAEADAAATRTTTWRRIGVVLGAGALAALLTLLISRSITRRIRAVANAANQVTTEQLPALVETLRDPRGSASLPPTTPIASRGDDELAELATAFNSMQETLGHVAHEQVEVLRRGVSDIFVTMARRNRSLIDRQLALLDEFEAGVDDPETLANYYQLDHMATRMRRNSESLLVLANAEPKRRRVRATEVDDVVRAAIGEIEDYQRIEIEALEPLHVRGNVVADVSHLLAELLDNATSFSPPESLVRVGGRQSGDDYMIRIVDSGIGISDERLREINDVLRNPPVVGLAVDSTLGMSVVSLLANKHGIHVTLSAGNPGLIVDVVVPPSLFGTPESRPVVARPEVAVDGPPAALAHADVTVAEEPVAVVQPAPEPIDEDRPVATSDWRKMSLSLAAFRSGMESASAGADAEPGTDSDAEDTPAETERLDAMAEAPAVAPIETGDAPVGYGDADPTTQLARPTLLPRADAADAEVELPSRERVVVPMTGSHDEADQADQVDRTAEPATELGVEGLSRLADALDSAGTGGLAPPRFPPPAEHAPSEFEVPPAPPHTTASPSQQPLTPDFARPAPKPAAGSPGLMPTLPTRLPGDGPDGGPDRLSAVPTPTVPNGDFLPTRSRPDEATGRPVDGTVPGPVDRSPGAPAAEPIEPLTDTRAATLDPEALRDRLRSFQAEFRSAVDSDVDADHHTDRPEHPDLGGDRR